MKFSSLEFGIVFRVLNIVFRVFKYSEEILRLKKFKHSKDVLTFKMMYLIIANYLKI